MTPAASIAVQEVRWSRDAIAGRIHEAAMQLGCLQGIKVYLQNDDGAMLAIVDDGRCIAEDVASRDSLESAGTSAFSFVFEHGVQVTVHDENGSAVTAKLVGAILQDSLRAMEAERREELLLQEVGANWESLEALYEISTDALRCGEIKDALKRLTARLTTLQDGLHSALFIRREGLFHPIVGTDHDLNVLTSSQLGPVERALRDMQVVLLNRLAQAPDEQACWRNAASLAAAPFSWEGSVGFVAVWNEKPNCEFDSSVSRMLEAITYQASVMMQGDRLNRKVRESELLAQEVEIASSIQQTLLQASAPTHLPGLEIASCNIPSQRIDGDFHDFFQHPDGSIDILLGDVMGKGVAAALLGAATKSQILRATANLALQSPSGPPWPAAIVARAASRLSDRLIALDRFVTLCYARFDCARRTMRFVDCGHTSIILESKSREACQFLRGADLPLGVLPGYGCEEHSIPLQPGETYLIYSDGVTESRSPSGELFGPDRLAECAQHWSSLGPDRLVEQIRKEAVRFTESEKFSDDFTCIAVKIKLPEVDSKAAAVRSASFACDSSAMAGLRAWLRECAGLLGNPLEEEDVARLQLACSEVFANSVIHSDEVPCATPLKVEARMFEDHISVQISHPGPVFDPLAIPSPAFDGSRDSGFGIYIVLRSSDEASFARQPDGTNITTLSFLRGTTERSL